MIRVSNVLEEMILNEFEEVPFHNLFFLHGIDHSPSNYGGTCSDKVLNFYRKLKMQGVSSRLCSGYIGGQETHRLIQVEWNGQSYFVDIGNGWPCIRPFPVRQGYEYEAFGLIFRSKVVGDSLEIYKSGKRGFHLMLSVPLRQKPEEEIREDIKNRFRDRSIYPFTSGLRFARVVGDDFLFLKGTTLTRYRFAGSIEKRENLDRKALERVITDEFNFQFPPEFQLSSIIPSYENED